MKGFSFTIGSINFIGDQIANKSYNVLFKINWYFLQIETVKYLYMTWFKQNAKQFLIFKV
jgi:hypothetical protein